MDYSRRISVMRAHLQARPVSSGSDTVLYTFDAATHIATVTLNRPAVKNALNQEAYAALAKAFQHVQGDPDVRCVILTAAGDSAFCSGDDVRAIMMGGDAAKKKTDAEKKAARNRAIAAHIKPQMTPAMQAVFDCDRPIICAVNGAAVGWGMDLVRVCYAILFHHQFSILFFDNDCSYLYFFQQSLCCDIRICSENARFASLFVKRG